MQSVLKTCFKKYGYMYDMIGIALIYEEQRMVNVDNI